MGGAVDIEVLTHVEACFEARVGDYLPWGEIRKLEFKGVQRIGSLKKNSHLLPIAESQVANGHFYTYDSGKQCSRGLARERQK